MALTSTLFTGLSGLDVNQTRLNVVGNNIANVNTTAFKSSRAIFKPQFYVTDSGGTPPDAEFGGVNPSQRGLGAVVGSIEKNWAQGSLEPTGKDLDMGIDGDGFFVVQGKQQAFTRDGTFDLNSANELVTKSGQYVMGFGVDVDNNVIPGALQRLTIPVGGLTKAKQTENVKLIGNLKADGPVAAGASILNSPPLTIRTGAPGAGTAPTALTPLTDLALASDPATAVFSGTETLSLETKKGGRSLLTNNFATAGMTVADLQEYMRSGMQIDTTVPVPAGVPAPGASLVALSGDPAGSARLTLTGNSGAENALAMVGAGLGSDTGTSPFLFADGGDGTHTSNPTGESVHTGFIVYDSLGTAVNVNMTAVLESKSDAGNTWRIYASSNDDTDTLDPSSATNAGAVIGTGTLTFDKDGKLIDSTGTTFTIDRNDTGAGTPITFTLGLDSVSQLSDTTGVSDLKASAQDGREIGTLSGYSLGENGVITGTFTNGLTQTLGQIAVATFNNPLGLEDIGGNQFIAGANSGVAVIGSPQTLGAGALRSGSLETSNVDLSEEFINMIISSTGFSASSRVITTSDQLIQELLNSAR
jgi:flagellar hook protein FlgE